MSLVHGRLRPTGDAPSRGEQTHPLADVGPVVVEQILSGVLDGPVDYCEDVDEWVVVLDGGATLAVDEGQMTLGPGDWVLLPAGTPHTLVETRPGTSWLTVTSKP